MARKMYHTQEKRPNRLAGPIICIDKEAWLGDGYYFWYYEVDAMLWGHRFKCPIDTGAFEIYAADIDCDDVLDTVFNEAHYLWWVKEIEKLAQRFSTRNAGAKPTLRQLNNFVREEAGWAEKANVKGILFEDLTLDNFRLRVTGLAYKKRIQVAVFDIKIVANFSLHKEQSCIKKTQYA